MAHDSRLNQIPFRRLYQDIKIGFHQGNVKLGSGIYNCTTTRDLDLDCEQTIYLIHHLDTITSFKHTEAKRVEIQNGD